MTMRAAIYYAPEADDPLWRAGIDWLGRDPEGGAVRVQPAMAGISAATESPRRYGFHATLKPPMALRHGLERLVEDARALVRDVVPFAAPALRVARLDGFLALTETVPSEPLRALADACVIGLDGHRVAESDGRMARRAVGLDGVGRDYLARFGYPHVLDRWRFHMTLSERLVPERIETAAIEHFAAAIAVPRMIAAIAVYVEPTPGAPFRLVRRIGFGRGDAGTKKGS